MVSGVDTTVLARTIGISEDGIKLANLRRFGKNPDLMVIGYRSGKIC
jgi:hypothetical protein